MCCLKKYLAFLVASLLCLAGCGNHRCLPKEFDKEVYIPRFAEGFAIYGSEKGESTIVKVMNPWQGASDVESLLLVRRAGEQLPEGIDLQVVDYPAQRIACLSSSYVAMLEALSSDSLIVAVSGKKFLFNPTVCERDVADIGYDEAIDYEALVSLETDLVLLYGVNGKSGAEKKLRELGIPYLYIGEYLENHPLGKAEWLMAIGEAVGCREMASSIFDSICDNYNNLRDSIAAVSSASKVKVMMNTPYGDSWFLPSPDSYMARLVRDAAGEYLPGNENIYRRGTGKIAPESARVDLEMAVTLVNSADIWLNADAPSISVLTERLPQVADSPCIRKGMVFNCDKRVNEAGGNDFWESSVVHPDLVLRDLASIIGGRGEGLYYYRRLE